MQGGGQVGRWLIVIGALCVAGLAIYVLTSGNRPFASKEAASKEASSKQSERPAMDQIDEESREAMRDLLRDVE